jgi:hypothetical protein
LTPPTAPPAPANASAATPAPITLQGANPPKLIEPLALRFPRLYYDFETVNTKGKIEDVYVPKKIPPTLADVIHAVCQSHGTTDRGLIGDLTGTINEFLGADAVKMRAKPPVVAPVSSVKK